MTCHAGPCLEEKNCLNKVNLKCSCKTLKKSFICNQLKFESSLIEFNKKENKYYLICNDVCKQKMKLLENKTIENTEKTAAVNNYENNSRSSVKYFMFALLFLIISIVLYIYLDR